MVLFTGPTQVRICDDIESGNPFPCEGPRDATLVIGLLVLVAATAGFMVMYVATILSSLPCYIGWLWPIWDAENRTFHDITVRTRAVLD